MPVYPLAWRNFPPAGKSSIASRVATWPRYPLGGPCCVCIIRSVSWLTHRASQLTSLYVDFGRKLRPHGRDRPFTSWFVHRERWKVLVVAPPTRSGKSPNGCQGRGSLREARICKDGPHKEEGELR